MADREMIAATLAAALLTGKDVRGSGEPPAEYAVGVYQKVLAALAAASASTPPRPSGSH